MPVSFCTASTVQAGPPIVNASLNCPSCAGSVPPPVFRQAGRLTQESRGKLIRTALSRLGERWARIVVSERAPAHRAVLAVGAGPRVRADQQVVLRVELLGRVADGLVARGERVDPGDVPGQLLVLVHPDPAGRRPAARPSTAPTQPSVRTQRGRRFRRGPAVRRCRPGVPSSSSGRSRRQVGRSGSWVSRPYRSGVRSSRPTEPAGSKPGWRGSRAVARTGSGGPSASAIPGRYGSGAADRADAAGRRCGTAEPAGVRGRVVEARRLGPRCRAGRGPRLGDRRVAGKPVRRSPGRVGNDGGTPSGRCRRRRRHRTGGGAVAQRGAATGASAASTRSPTRPATKGDRAGAPVPQDYDRPTTHRNELSTMARRPERSRFVTRSRRVRGGMPAAVAGRRAPPRARLLRPPLRSATSRGPGPAGPRPPSRWPAAPSRSSDTDASAP